MSKNNNLDKEKEKPNLWGKRVLPNEVPEQPKYNPQILNNMNKEVVTPKKGWHKFE